MSNLWNLIVESNTFNFAILLLIFAVLAEKIHLSDKLEKIKLDIINAIENARLERENANSELISTRKSVEHLEDEIKSRLNEASKKADGVSEKIFEEMQKQINSIEKNMHKAIESEEKTLSAKAAKTTLQNSVELAAKHIKTVLKNNPDLHNKFIEESIGVL